MIEGFDVTDDGRYFQQRTREHVTVRPATVADFTSRFDTWIERALQRLREDAEPW